MGLQVSQSSQLWLGLADRLGDEVLPGLEASIERLTGSSTDWLAWLVQLGGEGAGEDGDIGIRAEQLRLGIANGSVTLTLELLSGEELQGAQAFYAAGETGVGARILLNGDWAETATKTELERALLQQIGQAVVAWLNPGPDNQVENVEMLDSQAWLELPEALSDTQAGLFHLKGDTTHSSLQLQDALNETERRITELL